MEPRIGDTVKWSTSRRPLGVVVSKLTHKNHRYAIVESPQGILSIVRIYSALEIVPKGKSDAQDSH